MLIAGVDEAGRGPLAGPVVAAAVILDPTADDQGPARLQAADTGQPRRARRASSARAPWRGRSPHSDVGEIDALNILQATLLAMQRAIEQLTTAPEVVWIDGNQCPPLDYPSRAHRRWRSAGRRHRRGIDSRQDDARRDAGRARPQLPAVRIRPAQGLLDARASGRAGDCMALAPRTGAVRVRSGRPDSISEWRGRRRAKRPAALLFDVFGTVVDWRGSIKRELARARPSAWRSRRLGRVRRCAGAPAIVRQWIACARGELAVAARIDEPAPA